MKTINRGKYIRFLMCSFFLSILLCGCSLDNLKTDVSFTDLIKIMDMVNRCETLNDEGKYDEAIKKAHEILEIDSKSAEAYNMLFTSYFCTEKYEESLDAIDKSIEYGNDDSIAYSSKANALYELGKSEEALFWAEKSSEKSLLNEQAYYLAAEISYELGDYKKSKKYADKLYRLSKEYVHYVYQLFRTTVKLEKYPEANIYAEVLKNDFKENHEYVLAIEDMYINKNSEDELMEFYKEYYDTYKNNNEAIKNLGISYYEVGKYRMAQKCYLQAEEALKDTNSEIYIFMAYNEMNLDDMEKAQEYLEKYEKINGKDVALYNGYGFYYEFSGKYLEAAKYFEEAQRIEVDNFDASQGIIRNRYYAMRYKGCVQFYEETSEEIKNDYESKIIASEAYFQIDERAKGMGILFDLMENQEYKEYALRKIVYQYINNQDYENAEIYAEKLLEMDYENEEIRQALEIIKKRKEFSINHLIDFFEKNYLYKDEIDFEGIADEYRDGNSDLKSVETFVNRVKKDGDIFTYIISGTDYDRLKEGEYESVFFQNIDETTEYVYISNFDGKTDDLFIQGLDEIENKENKTLIIDIRKNGGGLIQSANNIINQFIEGEVSSNLIYRDGSSESYFTDYDSVKFKEIKIFVDEYTASSAELLALSLKTYLKNVEIIGRDTFGKGVGQYIYDNKEMKFYVAVVSMYWNVKEKNILETKIKPDIYVYGDNIKDYMKKIK